MSTIAPGAPDAVAPVIAESDGTPPKVGEWAEVPPAAKKNGPNSKFAPELNATAREAEANPGKARVISIQKTVRGASGRASTIKRKLKEGKVNGLEFAAENFEIVPRGSVVYAIYHPAKAAKPEAAAKPETAKPDAASEAKPEAKSETAKPAAKAASRPARPVTKAEQTSSKRK